MRLLVYYGSDGRNATWDRLTLTRETSRQSLNGEQGLSSRSSSTMGFYMTIIPESLEDPPSSVNNC